MTALPSLLSAEHNMYPVIVDFENSFHGTHFRKLICEFRRRRELHKGAQSGFEFRFRGSLIDVAA
jgi:hypothetical protein